MPAACCNQADGIQLAMSKLHDQLQRRMAVVVASSLLAIMGTQSARWTVERNHLHAAGIGQTALPSWRLPTKQSELGKYTTPSADSIAVQQ